MNINDVFPSKYLKAADLKGSHVTVTIASAEMEKVGDDKKLVIKFVGKEKGMIVNRTNADRIAFLYSPDTDGWIGKQITIFPDMVTFQGRAMEALRVRPPEVRRNGGQHVPRKYVEQAQDEPPPRDDFDDGEPIPF